jgi:CRISPR type I-E-associated protein CasB/Cse2
MQQTDREPWVPHFIGQLRSLLGHGDRGRDSAALAALRGGLTSHPGKRDAWVYGHLSGARPQDEESAALVASLLAVWHQGKESFGNAIASFGGSFGKLRTLLGSDNIEKQFASLIDSHPDDVHRRLGHAVRLLRAKEVSINWERLLRDLLHWHDDRRPVQRQWARDFWTQTSRTPET